MKSLIDINDFNVQINNSKCTTPSKSEGKNKVKVKMYINCIQTICKLNISK